MPSHNAAPVKRSVSAAILRYLQAPALVMAALALSELAHPHIAQAETYLFLAAVVASAWRGGRGPGLLAAVLAPFALDYFFYPPLYTWGISAQARPFVAPFLLAAMAAAWMSAQRTTARTASEMLERSEEKYRRILSNMPDVAWTGDESGKVLYISPKIEDILGYRSEEIRRRGLPFLLSRVDPADVPAIMEGKDQLFSGRSPLDVEFRCQHAGGEWRWLHCRATSVSRGNGVIVADGVMTDITGRKSAEVELRAKTAFLEAQSNSTIDGILVVDETGRRILENAQFARMFGIPPELLAQADDAPVLRHVVQMTRNPETFLARVRQLYAHPEETSRDEIELKSGTILDRYSSPVQGGDGRFYGRIWTFRDITERRQREDRMRVLLAAVEQSSLSVVITDVEGNITYTNRKFTQLTGYSAEEALGKNPRILNSGYSSPEMYRELWKTIRDGREWSGEFRNRKKNGEVYWEAASISPVLDRRGNIFRFLALKEDITEKRALETELRQAQKLEGIGQLAAGIAHEINTPTQFITDNLTFLEDAWTSTLEMLESCREAAREFAPACAAARLDEVEKRCDFAFLREEVPRAIEQGLEGAGRVASIVRAMKEFSHPDRAEMTDVDLNRGIASTITIARNEWKYVAEVETDFDSDLPPVTCYPGDINLVVLNLLVNAARALQEKLRGSDKGRITVSTRRHGDFAEIAVSDTGGGIPAEIQGRIFEPFFTTREVGSGTGQGLALAHTAVVRKHGGKIWFATEVGQGTTFFVQIPIHPTREGEANGREAAAVCR
ncbi:MAG TPA: PAS domain S-box protein [Acidobacteriaceae bacterium]|nr:PAS domain S-box protein [Acidobacteriaceae bacterium]